MNKILKANESTCHVSACDSTGTRSSDTGADSTTPPSNTHARKLNKEFGTMILSSVTSDGLGGMGTVSSIDKISDRKNSAALKRSAAGEESAETCDDKLVVAEEPISKSAARSMADKAITHLSISGPGGTLLLNTYSESVRLRGLCKVRASPKWFANLAFSMYVL